ncbi:MAG: hypothetical protein ACD_79C01025G0002 [uncultured bacterium]|nr:MAG: hypothetical protein ACD_79C01025G0002 [uncultured bacterium]
MSTVNIIKQKALLKNDIKAEENRNLFKEKNVLVLNIISSPGSGKTTLLENLAKIFKEKMAVITGDIQTTIDADRINKAGSFALQIETGGSCHLNAQMIKDTLPNLDFKNLEYLIIENIGNLVCPSTYDLGEHEKMALLSVSEGDEKPEKYPALFVRANTCVFSKTDLLPYVTFNVERARMSCLKLNQDMKIFEVSNTSQKGIDLLVEHFKNLRKKYCK